MIDAWLFRRRSVQVMVWNALLCVLAALLQACKSPAPRSSMANGVAADQEWVASTRRDDDDRTLLIRTNDFSGSYAQGEPIPVRVEIRWPGTGRFAQLFPHLTVWIEYAGRLRSENVPLAIPNRLLIGEGQTWRHEFNLAQAVKLAPGVQRVSVGHENYLVTDSSDWTGMLRSPAWAVRVSGEPARVASRGSLGVPPVNQGSVFRVRGSGWGASASRR